MLTRVLEELPPEIASQEQKESEEADSSTERIQRILEEISKVKNSGISPEEVKSETVSQEEFIYIYQTYKRLMNQNRLIDFDDMVLLCRDLLMQRQETLQLWQERFSYILIDEFQDICPLQYEVVRLLAKPQNNLFIVGDDDQSIYGFRGASPEIMLHFQNDYPNAAQVLLNENYRSKRDIVDAAGRLIMHNKERFSKEIKAHNTAENSIRIMPFPSKQQQALNITELIKQYMQQEDAKYSDIAILYRTNNHTVYTANQLMKSSIPFIMKERLPNLYEHWIVQDILTYVRIAQGNRERGQVLRVINRPKRYVHRNAFTEPYVDFEELKSFYEDKDWMLGRLEQLQYDLSMLAKMKPYAAVNFIRRGIGYDEYIREYADYRGIRADDMMEILDELLEEAKGQDSFDTWFDYMQAYKEELKEQAKKSYGQQGKGENDSVMLMTMHGAKGLEFECVFIPDANEGITPHSKSVLNADMEEERRMFYVAMTRAKEHLHIYYLKERFHKEVDVSRFVSEIMERKAE